MDIPILLDLTRIVAYAFAAPMWIVMAFVWLNNEQPFSCFFGFICSLRFIIQLYALAQGFTLNDYSPFEVLYTGVAVLIPIVFLFFFQEQKHTLSIRDNWSKTR
jgi:ABC-type phosphate transport system permease subunit